MIEISQEGESIRVVLKPNRSMSWRGNQLFLLSMFLLSGFIAFGFWLVGAWVVLPFAGLEMLVLSGLIYYVSWKLSYREVLTIDGQAITFEQGVQRPKQEWHFNRSDISLSVEPKEHSWSTPTIHFKHRQELISIGSFLNQADCDKLLDTLKEQGFLTKTYGPKGNVGF